LDLSFFFYPKSVAIIGASTTPGKVGYELVKNLVEGGFRGEILLVNPKGGRLFGLNIHTSITSLPSTPDVAIVVTPAETVPEIIEECGSVGVKGVIIISAGFSEVGNRDLEDKVVNIARRYGVRVIGPNSAGIINTFNNFHACMEFRVPKGPVSLISQSGAVGGVLFALAREGCIGFSKFVSCGNSCDVNEVEILEYLLMDDDTGSIALYIETIHDGLRFVDVCRRFKGVKPIIALKAGKYSAGMRAASSHTGAIASPYHIYSGLFKQFDILEVPSLGSLFSSSKFSGLNIRAKGSRIVIITNSGGPGVIATDLCEILGFSLPEPSNTLKSKLSSFLPSICSLRNPIDITAISGYEWYFNVLKEIALSGEYDIALVICVPPSFINPMEIAKAIYDFHSMKFGLPIIPCFMYGDVVRECIKYLEERNIPCTFNIEDAVYAAYSISFFGGVKIGSTTR